MLLAMEEEDLGFFFVGGFERVPYQRIILKSGPCRG
jgi:hypothetical protein